jgi:hypothetical protein
MSTPTPVPDPAAPSTITQIESAIASALAKTKAEESKIVIWLKANWGHFISWAGIAYSIFKHV